MDMEQWARVRHKVLVEKRSKRSVMAGEGLHWETLQKMLSHSAPPGYRRERERRRKIDAHVEWVRGVLLRDRFAACRVVATSVNSLSLVRFTGNDYSVPVRCAHREVVVSGYTDKPFNEPPAP